MYEPAIWDATPGVCCAYYQLGACDHTEALVSEFFEELEADWRRDFPEEAAAQDIAEAAYLADAAVREAARWNIEEPF